MKVTIVGAGAVGASCAEYIALKNFCSEVVLIDIKEGFAEGKSMDLMQTASLNNFDTKIIGSTNDYSHSKDSSVAVITSGIPRKPGMTREELIGINAGIVKNVTENLLKYSPNCIIVVVSNPMDTMTYLLHKEFKINKDKLLVTIYHDDEVAEKFWKKIANLPDSKIIKISSSDNFWSMGDTGPCGPCSEIFYDHGDKYFGGPPGSVDEDGDRFIEIWNLVFMQYEQVDKNTRLDLPKPCVDTGMGLERITALLNGSNDNYSSDLFSNIIDVTQEFIQKKISEQNKSSFRVIADHLRASSFLIADGVLPSNEGRGYVLRRILRRGIRHAYTLGSSEPLFHKIFDELQNLMGDFFQELNTGAEAI